MEDPILDELRRIREEQAASFNYDISAIYNDLKDKEKRSGLTFVNLSKKRRAPVSVLPADLGTDITSGLADSPPYAK